MARENVQSVCPSRQQHKTRFLAEYCSKHAVSEIPDPYYGGIGAFEVALDLIEDACENLLSQLMRQN